MSLFLLATCRVSGATLKPIKELRMDKERYQTQMAENITPFIVGYSNEKLAEPTKAFAEISST